MANPTRETIFKDAAKRLRAEFEDARNNIPHRGQAGGEGEQLVREFLNDHLPARFRATQGFIIDKADKVSGHMDIILYDAFNCPAYRVSNTGMIVPSDNVASVFEVKFQLTTTLLEAGLDKIHEAKNLIKTPIQNPHPLGEQIATYGVIFAFETALSEETVINRWHRCLTQANPLHNSCSMIVILDQGLFLTMAKVPGSGVAPVDFQGISPAAVGTEYGIGYLPYRERSLDVMLRMLIGHLVFFRHRTDHPGFDFEKLGRIKFKMIGRQVRTDRVEYLHDDESAG